MTIDEIKNNRRNIENLFGTRIPVFGENMRNSFYRYPILKLKNDGKYYLSEYIIQYYLWKSISEDKNNFYIFIDKMFDKHNIVEILTDVDDTMKLFDESDGLFIPDMSKLERKYNTKILFDGYHGFCLKTKSETFEEMIDRYI